MAEREQVIIVGGVAGVREQSDMARKAEFIGTQKAEGTDREQRDAARIAYEEIVGRSEVRGVQGVLESARDRWGEALGVDQPLTDLPLSTFGRWENVARAIAERERSSVLSSRDWSARSSFPAPNRESGSWEFTPRKELEEKRDQVVSAFFAQKNENPVKLSRTNFTNASRTLGVTCAVSKRYKREYQPYWYALHQPWLAFLRSVSEAYFVLGCMDRDEAYALPLSLIEQHLDDLNTTEKNEQERYWHVAFTNDNGRLALNLSSVGKKVDLAPYAFKLSKS